MVEFVMEHWPQLVVVACITVALMGFALVASTSNREQAAEQITPDEEPTVPSLLQDWRDDLHNVDMDLGDFLEKWYPLRDQLRILREDEKAQRRREKARAEQLRRMCENRVLIVGEDKGLMLYATEHMCKRGDIVKADVPAVSVMRNEYMRCGRCGREFNLANEAYRFHQSQGGV